MRLVAVDIARGVAIVLMIGYHGCWDLTWFGLTRFALLDDPVWLVVRSGILALFLGLVGIGLVLATRQGIVWPRVAIRLGMIGGGALAVTLATAWLFPESYIFFGVLHHVAVASVLGLAFVRLPVAVVVLAAGLCLAAPSWLALPVFDRDGLAWLGLMSHELPTNDYVPLLPWFGVVLAGIAGARLAAMAPARLTALAAWRPTGSPGRALAWAGRHSLAIYLIHQPVLFGAVYLVVALAHVGAPGAILAPPAPAPPALPAQAEGFLGSCQVSCEKAGGSFTRCAGYCRCVAADLQDSGLWLAFRGNRLDQAGETRLVAIVNGCAKAQGQP